MSARQRPAAPAEAVPPPALEAELQQARKAPAGELRQILGRPGKLLGLRVGGRRPVA